MKNEATVQDAVITTDAKIVGGSPIVAGTRTTVRAISGYYQMGMSVDEIRLALPHLTLAQIHHALGYYFDHQDEIEKERAENEDIETLRKEVASHPKAKRNE
jgi:uncharacterized protein (DUF433 family)